MRAGVACGWFGIQTWIGGRAIFAIGACVFDGSSATTTSGATAATISIGIGDAAVPALDDVAELRDLLGPQHR